MAGVEIDGRLVIKEERLPDGQVRRIYKEIHSKDERLELNLYIVGDLMYQSNYVSGLRIVDISNRSEPREVGFLDTVSGNDAPGFDGSWSNYPFFDSGTIVVTSGKEGVFFLRRQTRPIS